MQKIFRKISCNDSKFFSSTIIPGCSSLLNIKELGVNAVQLVPIFDQANDEINPTFNWGYNPLNYNSLDGVYSSNPYDGYEKIKEFKELLAQVDGLRYAPRLNSENHAYFYECQSCHKVYSRKRRINTLKYVCGSCRGQLILKNQS